MLLLLPSCRCTTQAQHLSQEEDLRRRAEGEEAAPFLTGQGGFSDSTGAQQTQWACRELLPVARGLVCPGLPRRGAAASNFTDPAIAMKSASEVLVYS